MHQRPSRGDDTYWKVPQVSLLDVYLKPVTHCPYTWMFSPREAEPDSNIYHLGSFPLKDASLGLLVFIAQPQSTEHRRSLSATNVWLFSDGQPPPYLNHQRLCPHRYFQGTPAAAHVRHQPRRHTINHLDVTRNNTSLRHILPKLIPYLNAINSTQILLAKPNCFR